MSLEDFCKENNLDKRFPYSESNIDTLLDFADMAAYEEKWDVLESIASRIIELDSENEDGLFYKGQSIHALDENNKDALEYYDKVISIGGDRAFLACWGKSVIHCNVGEFENALDCCRKLENIAPDSDQIQELKEKILFRLNDHNLLRKS